MKFICLIMLALVSSNGFAHSRSITEVAPGIYRGPRPQAEDYAFLKAQGFKTIISLQGGDYSGNRVLGYVVPYWEKGETPAELALARQQALASGLNYFNFPINSLAPVREGEAEAIRAILDMMVRPELQPVLIHCARGVDRTGLIIALYRLVYENVSPRDAFNEMILSGRNLLHRTFTFQLSRYFHRFAKDHSMACELELVAEEP